MRAGNTSRRPTPAGSLTDSLKRAVRPALMRLELLPPIEMARTAALARDCSVSVTRAFAFLRVRFVSRPDTVSPAPGASVVAGR